MPYAENPYMQNTLKGHLEVLLNLTSLISPRRFRRKSVQAFLQLVLSLLKKDCAKIKRETKRGVWITDFVWMLPECRPLGSQCGSSIRQRLDQGPHWSRCRRQWERPHRQILLSSVWEWTLAQIESRHSRILSTRRWDPTFWDSNFITWLTA